jgi:hypothetical protein
MFDMYNGQDSGRELLELNVIFAEIMLKQNQNHRAIVS